MEWLTAWLMESKGRNAFRAGLDPQQKRFFELDLIPMKKLLHLVLVGMFDDMIDDILVVDGMVDAPDTLGKMLGKELFQQLRETKGMEHDGLILPERVAETYFHLSQQHRSAWSHEVDIRAFSDTPWWNH